MRGIDQSCNFLDVTIFLFQYAVHMLHDFMKMSCFCKKTHIY